MKLAGRHKLAVMRALAEGIGPSEIARQYECDPSAVSKFARRYAAEIAEIRADFENEFAGLWIAKKQARLAEYQQDVENYEEFAADVPEYARLKQAALKAAAEELGALKYNLQTQSEVTHYVIEGIDPKELT